VMDGRSRWWVIDDGLMMKGKETKHHVYVCAWRS
jgi:hypothetical protein